MKRQVLAIISLVAMHVLPAAAFADTPPSATYAECIATRIDKLSKAADVLQERASVIATASRANPALARSIADVQGKLMTLRADLQPAICRDVPIPVKEQALIRAGVGMSLLRSNVARVNLALYTSDDDAAKKAGREMSDLLDKLALEIPPEEPTRGCQ